MSCTPNRQNWTISSEKATNSICAAKNASSAMKFKWFQVIELGYIEESMTTVTNTFDSEKKTNAVSADKANDEPICFHCGCSGGGKLSRCSKCLVASYCSRDCQVKSWKGEGVKLGHKYSCKAYKRVGEDMMIVFNDDKDEARQDILYRIRFYAFPYAIHNYSINGRGFLFLQSSSSLATLSLPEPILSNGRIYSKQRSVLLHWLTMKDYDTEVCMDDFELASVRKELKAIVETYDEKVEVPVLLRFRCGHVAVGLAPLVPDFKLCSALGEEYYGKVSDAVQLNIDDM